MDPTFSTRADLLSRIRLTDRTEASGPIDLALLEFSVASKQTTGKTPTELLVLYPDDARLQVAETLFVKSVLLRDLPHVIAGSSTNPSEVWNEEPATRNSSQDTSEELLDKANELLYVVSQEIQGEGTSESISGVVGSDDSDVYKDVFGTVEASRDLF